METSKKFLMSYALIHLFFLAAVVVAGILIYPFITPLILSVITAYIFNPIVKRLEVHYTFLSYSSWILVIIIGLPIIFAIWYLSANAAVFSDIAGFGDKLKEVIQAISDTIAGIGFGAYAGYFLSAQDITSKTIEFAIKLASDFIKSIPFFSS